MIAVPVGIVFLAIIGGVAWAWSWLTVKVGDIKDRLEKLERASEAKSSEAKSKGGA